MRDSSTSCSRERASPAFGGRRMRTTALLLVALMSLAGGVGGVGGVGSDSGVHVGLQVASLPSPSPTHPLCGARPPLTPRRRSPGRHGGATARQLQPVGAAAPLGGWEALPREREPRRAARADAAPHRRHGLRRRHHLRPAALRLLGRSLRPPGPPPPPSPSPAGPARRPRAPAPRRRAAARA